MLVNELECLRGELELIRSDRDRQLVEVQGLTKQVAHYEESIKNSCAQLDNLARKTNALEVFFFFFVFTL